jgi:hypothetical protein
MRRADHDRALLHGQRVECGQQGWTKLDCGHLIGSTRIADVVLSTGEGRIRGEQHRHPQQRIARFGDEALKSTCMLPVHIIP